MALYSMYPGNSSQLIYQDSPQRARQQTLQSQLSGYYSDQHALQQPQGLGLSDATPTYARPFNAAYDQMPMGYPITQSSAYASNLPITEDLHHGYSYPRIMQSGLLPGMSDEADTASRPRLTAEQTRELEALYAANNKPSTQQKQEYAQRFRLTKNRVDNWFQNRRAKSKHQNKAKQAELAMTNITKTEPDSGSKNVSKGSSYDSYNPYNDDMSSQTTTIDLLASTSYTNDQGQELVSSDDSMPINEDTWDSHTADMSDQPSTTMAYSNNSEFTNHHHFNSEACTSPSPISLKSFDHKSAASYQLRSHLANEYPSEAFTRRGSTLSDLASHVNGIRIPSEQTPTPEMFCAEPPRRGLGDRRPQRPAALATMRSTSSGATLRSPLLIESNATQSLRRINTCGTPLNRTGRIQKYGPGTPQRSPRALSQALERAMDQLTPHIDPESLTPEQIESIDQIIEEKEAADGVIFNVNPPSSEVAWVENTNVDFPVPPLSASLTGDDGSPPITPLPGQGTFTNPWTGQEMSTITSTAVPSYVHSSLHDQSQCIAPQAQHSLHHFWDGTNVNDVFSMSSAFDFAQAHISRPASLGPHYTYGSISRRSEPLKIEFSHPYQDAQPHYYVPLRENHNYTFQEYNPDNARRE